MSADMTQTRGSWLSDDALEQARGQLPVVYVDAIPVRVDDRGQVTSIGLLLAANSGGMLSRMFVSGRVQRGERIRDALLRHIEKDLGPLALPRIPPSPQPFTVVEYFPDPTVTGFVDERQHAVSLAYVVPVDGECRPSQQALEIAWLTPLDAFSPDVLVELPGGRDRLLRMAMAHVGVLP
jgi:ADP-ribose pyrophosphatase YjhB (NUDIX family)